MAKIKLEVSLIHNNNTVIFNNYNGIKVDNIIKYKDEQTNNILDLNKNILKRNNKEYNIILNFNEKKGMYNYQNLQIPIKLNNVKITKTKNLYCVKYELIMGEENIGIYTYKISNEVAI